MRMKPWQAWIFALASTAPRAAFGDGASGPVTGPSSESSVVLLAASLGDPQALARMIGSRGEWRAEGGQFAKLEMRFAGPTPVSKIEIESCGESFADGVEAIVNFDHTRTFVEGGKRTLAFAVAPAERPLEARSLVLNFRYNENACVREIRVMNGAKRLALRPPGLLAVEGGPPAAPFDSRLETSWSSGETGPIELRFASERNVSRVRVWNGDPRNPAAFKGSPRVKTLALSTGKSTEKVSLEDSPAAQVVSLKNPLRGKVIRVSVEGAHGGAAGEARLAELQFGDADGFSGPDVSTALRATAEARKAGFRASGLGDVVDRALRYAEDDRDWTVRLRSDGSVFIKGQSESLERARAFSFLGRYEIVEATGKRLRLKLSGARFTSSRELDASVCAADCAGGSGPAGQWLEDEISFGRAKDGLVFVRDEGPRRAVGLDFHDFKARILKSGE